MYVVNRTRRTYLGVNIRVANSFLSRMLGLYRFRRLEFGDGVWLIPCKSIQTIGMRYAIDVVFFDAAGEVVGVFENVQPGRVIWPVPRAHSALEVPVGVIRSSEAHVGDHVEFVEDLDAVPQGRSSSAGRLGTPGRSIGRLRRIKLLPRVVDGTSRMQSQRSDEPAVSDDEPAP